MLHRNTFKNGIPKLYIPRHVSLQADITSALLVTSIMRQYSKAVCSFIIKFRRRIPVIFGINTKYKRNIERFPKDFMFMLSEKE